jgi:hypothetical protein
LRTKKTQAHEGPSAWPLRPLCLSYLAPHRLRTERGRKHQAFARICRLTVKTTLFPPSVRQTPETRLIPQSYVKNTTRRTLFVIAKMTEIIGARGGDRTRMTLRSGDFKSPASTIPPPGRWATCGGQIARTVPRHQAGKVAVEVPLFTGGNRGNGERCRVLHSLSWLRSLM